ncbi:hypothetical protein NC652_009063 [Populus alba x Populus x berolinensis]|nr:hypothetical protein NC652_009063 [Populus alba x Populus x berolinensis]
MMSPNSKMAEQLKLHQRWEFRRKDNDSDSSNDSKPSGEPALKTYKLISSFISVDSEETSEATKLHQNGICDPGISDQMKSGKAENGRRRRKSRIDDSAPNEIKKGPRKGVRRKKSKTITDEQAVFYDLKKYMSFLLEDLKVSRENLLKWMGEEMQKLVAEETVSELETRERSFRGEKVQLQNQTNFEENAEVQDQNIFEKNIPAQHQNNIQGYGHLQAHKEFEENVHRQNLVNFENTEVHHQETIFLHNRNAFKSFKGAQDCNDESTERFGETNKSADYSNCSLSLDSQAGYSRANVPSSTTEKDSEERMALSANLNSKPSSSDQYVQVQQLNSIVLGIRAQRNNKSSERSAKGRNTSDSNSHHQVPEHQSDCAQVIGFLTSAERDKGERLPLSVEPMFPANSNQVASSMYLTLPTVLTKPHVANHRFDTSSLNSIQPRLSGNQTGLSSERPNLLLGSSSHHGYFQDMQSEERIRNFAQVSSRDISYFNQMSTSSIAGNGLPVPFFQAVNSNFNIPTQVSLENLARESSMPSPNMRGPGGSYSFSEQFTANNFLNHSSYKVDGRLMAYQDGYQFLK